jgi:serine-type D-Ala-D-Ala carboxypeptidase/endopeptidase (penicillin-binding protein 4)
MRTRIALASASALVALGAAPATADTDSLAERARAAADAASLQASVTSRQANATMAFLIPLRINNPRIGDNFAFDVVDTATGEAVFSRQATEPKRPASNMKIVTAISALHVLGPQTRMTTDVLAPGAGQLIVRGGGDATLGVTGLTRLAKKAAKYVKRNGLLPDLVQPPSYRPKTCTVDGKTRRSTPKRPCPLVVPPQTRPAVKIFIDDSLYGDASKGPGWTDSYQPGIARPVRALGRIGVYQWDSAQEAASVFAAAVRSAGVKATVSGRLDAEADDPVAASFRGDTVAAQVRYMLQVSENNIAEMLYRQVAVERGRKGTWKGARLAARDTMRELGLNTESLRLLDGSGLSRDDRLTARFLTEALQVALDTEQYPEFASFFDALPVGGRTGTLAPSAARYTTAPSRCAAGKVHAKTGTLFDTIGLSGYAEGADGELRAFSALVNDRPQNYSPLSTRQAVDGLVATVNGCWGPTEKTGTPPPVE